MVNIRVYKNRFSLSKPCDDCIQLMKKYNFKRVIYTVDEFTYAIENINTITNKKSNGRTNK